jgi:serine/threonine protein phosphatase 1
VPLSLTGFQERRVRAGRPSLPTGLRIYAVGDIHGRVDLLDKLLARIDTDIALRTTTRPVCVFLGDYIDRGSSSRETIDRLIEHGETHESIFLKGNHELMAIKCLTDPNLFDGWMRLGGLETLESYGVAFKSLANARQIVELQAAFHMALPQAHFRFFRCLKSSFACGDFFFAHAGVKTERRFIAAEGKGSALDKGGIPVVDRRFWLDYRSRPYAHKRDRSETKPDQY